MLIVEPRGSVLNLTLDRPEVRNAFNDELISRITEAFSLVAPKYRAVVLRGKGQAFCAGGDLTWMQKAVNYSEQENYEDALKLAWMFSSMVNCRVPIIALIDGPTYGGGCGLVAASDIAIGTGNARFAFSEVKLGLVPATIAPYVISKIGVGATKRYFTTGEPFTAETALRIGLLDELISSSAIEEKASEILSHILNCGPNAVSLAKGLAQQKDLTIEGTAQMIALARVSHEGQDGVRAFLERRSASFVEEVEPK